MNGPSEFDLLTLEEAAELLHVSKAHLSHVVGGRVPGCTPIPAVHLGRRTLIRRSSLLGWIATNEHAAANGNTRPAANDNLQVSPGRGRRSA